MTQPANLIFFQSDKHNRAVMKAAGAFGMLDSTCIGFAEYHAQASKAAAYVLRDRYLKLIYPICDPEAVDARAKADQRKWVEHWGGKEKVAGSSQILFTPPPGVSKEDAWAIPATNP